MALTSATATGKNEYCEKQESAVYCSRPNFRYTVLWDPLKVYWAVLSTKEQSQFKLKGLFNI